MDDNYLTIFNCIETLYEEKKSKFFSNSKHVTTESEALEFVEKIKSAHKCATHNTFAYDVLDNISKQKCSDDGEPQGTAGCVILEALKKRNLKNTVLVVTRYFGGLMLGAGGLIRAYSKAANLCLDSAEISKKICCSIIVIKVEYSFVGKVKNFLITNKYKIEDIDYQDCVIFRLSVPKENIDALISNVEDITFANAKIKIIEQRFMFLDHEPD